MAATVQPISAETLLSDQIGGFKSPTRMVLSDSGVLYVSDHKKASVTVIDTVENTTAASDCFATPIGAAVLEIQNTVECRKSRKRQEKYNKKTAAKEEKYKEKASAKGQKFNQNDFVANLNVAGSETGTLNGFIAPLGVAVLEIPPSDICTKYRGKKDKCKEWIHVPGKTYLYVGDEGDGSVQVFINGEKKDPLGIGIGEFTMPNGIAVTKEQTVYVVDSKLNEVRVYDSSGNLQTVFGTLGLDFPTDIALNETAGELYVSDYYNRRIRVFDLSGGWLRDIFAPLNDQGDPVFYRPAGLGIDPEGNLYVVDNALSCVAKINSQGDLLETIGYRDGQYWTGDLSIPVDAAGYGTKIYVTSNGQRQLRVFEVVP